MTTKKAAPVTFGELPLIDRITLYASLLTISLIRIAREDVEKWPLLYILYAMPIGFVLAPVPLPGANIIPLVGVWFIVAGWAWLGLTADARRNKAEIKRDFAPDAVIDRYRDWIIPHRFIEGKVHVQSGGVARYTGKTMWNDSKAATICFFRFLFGLKA